MAKSNKMAIGVGALALGGILLAVIMGKKAAPPPGGPVDFTIRIINLPSEANQWGCAFQDPATGEYYQPTNRPIMGSHLFDPSESAELSSPVSSGILSISAFAQASAMAVTQIINYQISTSVANGDTYTFDFSTGQIT